MKIYHSIWQDYIRDCGRNKYLSNELNAKKNFDDKYSNIEVVWHGYYVGFDVSRAIDSYPYSILVKMNPSDASFAYPDISLRLNEDLLKPIEEKIKSLQKGQEVVFNANLMRIGNEFYPHQLKLLNFEKSETIIKLEEIEEFHDTEKKNLRKTKKEIQQELNEKIINEAILEVSLKGKIGNIESDTGDN